MWGKKSPKSLLKTECLSESCNTRSKYVILLYSNRRDRYIRRCWGCDSTCLLFTGMGAADKMFKSSKVLAFRWVTCSRVECPEIWCLCSAGENLFYQCCHPSGILPPGNPQRSRSPPGPEEEEKIHTCINVRIWRNGWSRMAAGEVDLLESAVDTVQRVYLKEVSQ